MTEARFYSEDQPRDERGRWTSSAGSAESATTTEGHRAAAAYHRERAKGIIDESIRMGEGLGKYSPATIAAAGHEHAAVAHERAILNGTPLSSKLAREASRDAHFTHHSLLGPESMYQHYDPEAKKNLAAEEGQKFYSEDQPRDDHEGGGEKTEKKGPGRETHQTEDLSTP